MMGIASFTVLASHVGQPAGLPAHDVVAYVASIVAVAAGVLALAGALISRREVKKLRRLYKIVISYIGAEEAERLNNQEDQTEENKLKEGGI